MLSNWQTLSLIPTRTKTDSSCSALCRASTSRDVSQIKEVHGRDNLGHAAAGRSRMTLFGIMACKIQSRLWVKSRGSGVDRRPSGLLSIAYIPLRCRKPPLWATSRREHPQQRPPPPTTKENPTCRSEGGWWLIHSHRTGISNSSACVSLSTTCRG